MIDLKSMNQLNFVGALLLHQKRRDDALGLTHITTKQRGLLWYYDILQKELFRKVATSSYKLGAIRQIEQRMDAIITEAEQVPTERKRELLKEAIRLKKQAQRIKKIGRQVHG